MDYFSTTHFMVYGFLLFTLVLGLYAGRNVRTFQDYATANKSLSQGVLTITMLATIVGSGYLTRPGHIYLVGPLPTSIVTLSQTFYLFLIAIFLAPKLLRFHACYTMADMMGAMYGTAAKLLMSCLEIGMAILVVSAQAALMGQWVAPFLGITVHQATIGAGCLILAYATLGGMRAVAFTDVLQLVVVLGGIALLAHVVLQKTGNMQSLIAQMNQVHPQKMLRATHIKFWGRLPGIFFWGFFSWILAPAVVQRMLMARKTQDVRTMFLSAAAFVPLFKLSLAIIGMGALILYPGLQRSEVMPHVIHHTLPALGQGLLLASIMAVLLSTADSFLHAAAITTIHSFLGRTGRTSETRVLRYVRVSTLILGGISLTAATVWNAPLYLNYVAWVALSFFYVPWMAGIMGLKTHSRDLSYALASALIVTVAGWLWLWRHTHEVWYSGRLHHTWLVAWLASTTVFFASHYLRHGGFVFTTMHAGRPPQFWQLRFSNIIAWFFGLLPTPTNTKQLANTTIFAAKETYVLAFFLCLNYLAPLFMSPSKCTPNILGTFIVVKLLAALLCTGLLASRLWRQRIATGYFYLYWFTTVTYCLPFMASFVFILDGGGVLAIFNLTLAITLLLAISDWKGFLIMSSVGALAAWGVHHVLYGAIQWYFDVDTAYLLVYGVAFSLAIGGLFVRKTAKHNFDSIKQENMHAGMINHEIRSHLAAMGVGATFKEVFSKGKVITEHGKELYLFKVSLPQRNTCLSLAESLLKEQKRASDILNVFTVVASKGQAGTFKPVLLAKMARELASNLSPDVVQSARVEVVVEQDFKAELPVGLFPMVIENLIHNAEKHGKAACITLYVDGRRGVVRVQDDGKGIAEHIVDTMFDPFVTRGKKRSAGIGLAFVRQTMEATGGGLDIIANKQMGDPYTTFQLTFARP